MKPVVRKKGERGYALLFVFLMAAMVAIMLYKELPRIAFESRRNQEELLVERGEQYKRAIQLYFRKFKAYPPTMEALENSNNIRFLRRRYKDPITGKDEWRIIHVGQGGVLTDSITQKNQQQKDSKSGWNNSFIGEMPALGSAQTGVNPARDPRGPQRASDERARQQAAMGMNAPTVADPNAPQQPIQPGQPPLPPGVAGGAYTAMTPNTNAPPLPPGVPQPGIALQPGQTAQLPGQVPTRPTNQNTPVNTGNFPAPVYTGGNAYGNQPQQPQQPGVQPGTGLPPNYPNAATNSQFGGRMPYPTNPGANGNFPVPPQPGSGPSTNVPAAVTNQIFNPSAAGGMGQSASSMGSMGGQQIGGGIAGVASTDESEGIKIYNEYSKYNEWEFIFDYSKERAPNNGTGLPGQQAGQQNQQRQGGGFNNNPGSGFNNNPGTGFNNNPGSGFGGGGFNQPPQPNPGTRR